MNARIGQIEKDNIETKGLQVSDKLESFHDSLRCLSTLGNQHWMGGAFGLHGSLLAGLGLGLSIISSEKYPDVVCRSNSLDGVGTGSGTSAFRISS